MSYLSRVFFTGDGSQTVFAFSFPYLDQDHVEVYVDGVQKALTADFEFLSDNQIGLFSAPAASTSVEVRRNSSQTTRLVTYTSPSTLGQAVLNRDSLQAFYMAQEAYDEASLALLKSTQYNLPAADTANAFVRVNAAGNAYVLTSLIYIDENGNLGIRTSSPNHDLDIEKDVVGEDAEMRLRNHQSGRDSILILQTENNGICQVFFGDGTDASDGRISYYPLTGGQNMRFWIDNVERLRIDKDGNVDAKTGKVSEDGTELTPDLSIVLWPSAQPIPTGWLTCDGTSGTPSINGSAPSGTVYIQKAAS